MRLIIAGSRSLYPDYDFLDQILVKYAVPYDFELVNGRCPDGVDWAVWDWAKERDFNRKPFPADWKKYGKSAGPVRNAEMAEYATHLIAIWDGVSSGTANMIDEMKKRHKPYRKVVLYDGSFNNQGICYPFGSGGSVRKTP